MKILKILSIFFIMFFVFNTKNVFALTERPSADDINSNTGSYINKTTIVAGSDNWYDYLCSQSYEPTSENDYENCLHNQQDLTDEYNTTTKNYINMFVDSTNKKWVAFITHANDDIVGFYVLYYGDNISDKFKNFVFKISPYYRYHPTGYEYDWTSLGIYISGTVSTTATLSFDIDMSDYSYDNIVYNNNDVFTEKLIYETYQLYPKRTSYGFTEIDEIIYLLPKTFYYDTNFLVGAAAPYIKFATSIISGGVWWTNVKIFNQKKLFENGDQWFINPIDNTSHMTTYDFNAYSTLYDFETGIPYDPTNDPFQFDENNRFVDDTFTGQAFEDLINLLKQFFDSLPDSFVLLISGLYGMLWAVIIKRGLDK